MLFSTKTTTTIAAAAAFGAIASHAFAPIGSHAPPRRVALPSAGALSAVRSPSDANQEAEKLRTSAARLREEADELAREQARERSLAARRAFDMLDTDGDGALSLEELKAGLEKTYQLDVPEDRVRRLMDDLDASGDGRLQPDEFIGIGQFRNRLEAMADAERRQEMEAKRAAQKEAEIAQLVESQLELINDKPPSGTDRIVSVLPYLLPLMDGLSYGKFFLAGHEDNPLVGVLALLYTVYASIPLGGFLAFFGLTFLSGNLAANRLVRFNAQQAIYLDVALFLPGLVATLAGAASAGLGVALPPGLGELGSDAVFATLAAAVGYSAVSSLLGATPDKIPFLSEAVDRRVPSAKDIQFLDPATGEPLFKSSDEAAKGDEDKADDA